MKHGRSTATCAVVLALAVVAGASACASDSAAPTPTATPLAKGGLLTVYTPYNPAASGWNPASADPRIFRVMGPQVMATLLRPDLATGAPVPWLAESVAPDEAATTWTVKLRAGLTFDDGTSLTARDTAFMLAQAAKVPTLASRFGADDDGTFFTSATATDDVTVVVTLRKSNALLDRLVFAAPEFGCVKRAFGGQDREDYFDAPASCGPFRIGNVGDLGDAAVRLERNVRYAQADEVLPDSVLLGSDGAVRRAADIVLSAPPAGTPLATAVPETSAPATDPATTEPATSEPATSEPATSEPATTEPATTEPATTASPTATATSNVAAPATAATPPATTIGTPSAPVDPLVRVWTDDELVASPPGATTMLVLKAVRPTRDQNLRLALRALPDLPALAAGSSGAVPATTGTAPVGFNGAFDVPVAGGRPDIATTAVELVPEDGRTVRLLVDATDPVAVSRAQLLAAEASAVGITLELDREGRSEYDEAVNKRRFEAALLTVAPTVGDAAELPRLWARTLGFGGAWPADIGREAFTEAVAAPAHGQASIDAAAAYEDTIRREAYVVPLVTDVHRIANATGVPGAAVGVLGEVPFEQFAPAGRQF
jgi:hypothetical protein